MNETETALPTYRLHISNITFSAEFSSREHGYQITFAQCDASGIYDPDKETRKKIKQAFAALRKAIKAYRHSGKRADNPHYTGYDCGHSETGDRWIVYRDVLYHFATWLIFPEHLDVLIDRADKQREIYLLKLEERLRASRAEREAYFASFFGRAILSIDGALSHMGLDRSVTLVEIKKRYRQLSLKHHPDMGGQASDFRQLNQAYQTLLNWRKV